MKELETLFDQKFAELDMLKEGQLDKEQVLQLVNYVITNFAQIWCTKAEIMEVRKKIINVFETEVDNKISKLELFEIFYAILTTIRVVHMTKSKLKDFDLDHNGDLDEKELTLLVDWMLKAYERSGLKVRTEETDALRDRIIANYEIKGSAFLGIRELSLFFEKALEVCI
jgi:hypothetical protein